MENTSSYDLLPWSREMSQKTPGLTLETLREYVKDNDAQEFPMEHDNQEVQIESSPAAASDIQPTTEGGDTPMEGSFPDSAEEATKLISKLAKDYRKKHYNGEDSQRVRWNKDGADELIWTVKRALKVPGVNRMMLAKAAEVTYPTLTKWLEDSGKKPSDGRRKRGPAPKEDAAPKSAKTISMPKAKFKQNAAEPGGDDTLCFDIEKVDHDRLRVWLSSKNLKAFINNL